jgi:membrane dipeptidase
MALDLSHLSPRGCELALERYGGPVLASHANASSVFANPRNLADDVLAGVGERGGVVGLCAVPAFVGPGEPARRLAQHHAHISAVAGADAVAFGADFCDFFGDGMDLPLLPEQPTDVDRLLARQAEPPRETFYAEVLLAAGQRDDGPLAWGNALRFLEGVLT